MAAIYTGSNTVYNEWLKYRKWHAKQVQKGFTLSDASYTWAKSPEEYAFQRGEIIDALYGPAATYSKKGRGTILQEIQRTSYNASSRQIEHLAGQIQEFLDDAGDQAKEMFLERYGAELEFDENGDIDTQKMVYQTLKYGDTPLYIRTGKAHGWYGPLADMINYIETIGYSVSWNS